MSLRMQNRTRNATEIALALLARSQIDIEDAKVLEALSPLINWSEFDRMAGDAGLAGLIYEGLIQAAAHLGTNLAPAATQKRLAVSHMLIEVANRRYLDIAGTLFAAANEKGLLITPIKGTALLLNRTYRSLGVRVMTDIDLVVRRRDFAACTAMLLEHGFTLENESRHLIRHHHHAVFSLADSRGKLCVELHWTPYLQHHGRPDLDESAMARLQQFRHKDHLYQLLDNEDTLLCLLLHLATHRYSGQLKWLVDIQELIGSRGSEISWPLLWQRANELGATKKSELGLWLARETLGRRSLAKSIAQLLPADTPSRLLVARLRLQGQREAASISANSLTGSDFRAAEYGCSYSGAYKIMQWLTAPLRNQNTSQCGHFWNLVLDFISFDRASDGARNLMFKLVDITERLGIAIPTIFTRARHLNSPLSPL